jgi:TfoX/Sxy family transcriptional regulator of competence genes
MQLPRWAGRRWGVPPEVELRPSPPGRMIAAVAYDEELADRMRDLLGNGPDLTEKKMFGGLAFLIGGNMAVAASSQGGVLVRVDPAESDTLVATTNARPMEVRGRPMHGWLRVDPEDLRTKRQLAKWVRLGTTYARSLPTKR